MCLLIMVVTYSYIFTYLGNSTVKLNEYFTSAECFDDNSNMITYCKKNNV